MSNLIKFLLVSFVLPSIFLTQTVSALLSDSVDDSYVSGGACVNLENNLTYGKRDSNTNGEITKLQAFLHSNNYLTSSPTGFFGLQTKAAVKAFQSKVLAGVQANNIDNTMVTASSDRQELATTGFRLSNSGYVGSYTRAKIAYVSCGGGTTSSGNSTFTYGSNIAGLSPLYVHFTIDANTSTCLSESGYSVEYGDGQSEVVYPNWLSTTNGVHSAANNMSCLGYFANHTYAKVGNYTAKLIKLNCPQGAQCFPVPVTVATIIVRLGDTTTTTDLLQGPETCTVPTYDSGSINNTLAAANGTCEITLTWPKITAPLSSKLIKWQLDGSNLWSGNITLADDTLASKSKKFVLGQSKITVVISSNGQTLATKVISGVCASGASRSISNGRCVITPGSTAVSTLPPTITTTTLPNAVIGSAYTNVIVSTGGTGTRIWTTTGVLPTGMQLNQVACAASTCSQPATIGFTGSPTTAGTYTFTVTVTVGSQSFSKTFTIVVGNTASSGGTTCTWLYSAWSPSTCPSSGSQTRQVTGGPNPSGCTGGTQETTTRSCTYNSQSNLCPDGTPKPTTVIGPSTGCEGHEGTSGSYVPPTVTETSFSNFTNGTFSHSYTMPMPVVPAMFSYKPIYAKTTGLVKSKNPKFCIQYFSYDDRSCYENGKYASSAYHSFDASTWTSETTTLVDITNSYPYQEFNGTTGGQYRFVIKYSDTDISTDNTYFVFVKPSIWITNLLANGNPSNFVENGSVNSSSQVYLQLRGIGTKSNPPEGCIQKVGQGTCSSGQGFKPYKSSSYNTWNADTNEWYGLSTVQILIKDAKAEGYLINTDYEAYIKYTGESPIKLPGTFKFF